MCLSNLHVHKQKQANVDSYRIRVSAQASVNIMLLLITIANDDLFYNEIRESFSVCAVQRELEYLVIYH